jgi:hypothetical protein
MTGNSFTSEKSSSMKISLSVAVMLIACYVSVPGTLAQSTAVTAAEQKEGWQSLFDGSTTKGWTPRPPPAGRGATETPLTAKWAVENSEIQWVKDSGRGYLTTDQVYTNFILRLDFWSDLAANTGVNFGVPDSGPISSNSSFEVNIFDDTPQFPTGSINNVQRTSTATPQTASKWNSLEIARQDDHVTVVLNGDKVVDIKSALHPGGHIALQAPAAGTAKFKKVRVKTR